MYIVYIYKIKSGSRNLAILYGRNGLQIIGFEFMAALCVAIMRRFVCG